MKRPVLTLNLLLALLLSAVAMQFVGIALANPSLPMPYPNKPDTNHPLITIQIPENANNPPYSITIEKPSSWFENNTIHGTLRSVGYILDGENVTIADNQKSNLADFQSENPTITLKGHLSELSEGNHTIQVWVNSVSLYHPADTPQNYYGWWTAVAEYPVYTSSSTVHFSIVLQPEPFPIPYIATVSGLSLAIIGIGLVVYFRKHNRLKRGFVS